MYGAAENQVGRRRLWTSVHARIDHPTDTATEIPVEHDPRLVHGARTRRQRLAQLSPAQRAALVLERYPELRAFPSCDWRRLSVRASFSVLFGASAHHYAKLELAALAGILASAGVSAAYAKELEIAARRVLDLLRQRFGIATPRAITLDVWETWGRDTDLTRTLTDRVAKYAAAINLYQGDYRERLSIEDQAQVGYLLLPPLPKQFRQRFVPAAERRLEAQRNRKIKTDVVSECAMAILALMLARYPSMERFIQWYRQQIERIEAGELSVPVRLVYEDDQLDLPRQPGPDAVSVEALRWRSTRVQLELTIWRPDEFSRWQNAERIRQAVPGTREWQLALAARGSLRFRAKKRVHMDARMYFVEVHSTIDVLLLVAAIVCGSMLWWITLSNIIGRHRHRIDLRVLNVVNRVAGLLLAVFGAVLIAEVIWKAGRF